MSPRRRLTTGTAVLLLAGAMSACTSEPAPPPPGPIEWEWREITLPDPPAGHRIVLRSATYCDGTWYLGGAYEVQGPAPTVAWLGAEDVTDPAVWTSPDGVTWTEVPIAATSYYGIRSEMYSIACRDGRLVAVGGRPGGAHGNPRISTYHPVAGADGTEVLTEVLASNELYGGPNATNVGRLTAGPPGYLIVGNRSSGAAVWFSPDGAAFEIVEGAPVLGHSADRSTWAADAVYYDGAWMVVGGSVLTGRPDRDATAWRSVDARTWTSVPAESGPGFDELNVVVESDGQLIAIGQDSGAFQAWRLGADGWKRAGRFGDTRLVATAGPASAAIPIDLAAAGGQLLAVVQAGGFRHLWLSVDAGDSWSPVATPMPMPGGGGRGSAVVGVPARDGQPAQMLLAVDDGTTARAFVATIADE